MTLVQIDNYGPWTVTPTPRAEADLQILQSELYADLQRQFAAKGGLVFFTRFDNMLAATNGVDMEDHLRIQKSIGNRYPITVSMGVGPQKHPTKPRERPLISCKPLAVPSLRNVKRFWPLTVW